MKNSFSIKRIVGLLMISVSALFPGPTSSANNWLSGTPVAQNSEDAFEAEIQKATDLLRLRKFEDALKSFKRANEMRGKQCAQCFYGMARSYFGLEAYKNVVESADKLIALAGSDKRYLVEAHNLKGIALQSSAEGKNEKKLQQAEAAFREGLSVDTQATLPVLHFNLGYVLMQLKRDPEGIAAMNKYLELEKKTAEAERAARMIANPRRAREAYAPDFSFTSSEGEHITLEDLRGKVVVLDFWGTWCPPCVESIPSLRSLNKKFTKEPSFLLIGVSSDSDEETWKEFTTKEKMIWPQFLDQERQMQRAFNVRAFPTYIVIDHEGIIRFRSIGTSWERSADLQDTIKKYLKVVAKTNAVNEP